MSLLKAIAGSLSATINYASISAAWSNIDLTFPTSIGTNETRTITWSGGGSRNFSASYAVSGTLSYSKNSAAYSTYSAPISLSSGDTLSWRYVSPGFDESGTVSVVDDSTSTELDAFSVSVTGSP